MQKITFARGGVYILVENNKNYCYSRWEKLFGFGPKAFISNPVSC